MSGGRSVGWLVGQSVCRLVTQSFEMRKKADSDVFLHSYHLSCHTYFHSVIHSFIHSFIHSKTSIQKFYLGETLIGHNVALLKQNHYPAPSILFSILSYVHV